MPRRPRGQVHARLPTLSRQARQLPELTANVHVKASKSNIYLNANRELARTFQPIRPDLAFRCAISLAASMYATAPLDPGS